MHRIWLALLGFALTALPASAQYHGPGSAGAPLGSFPTRGFYGRGGVVGFGTMPQHGHHHRGHHGGFHHPGFPAKYGYGFGLGYFNPYVNSYYGYATPGIYVPPVYYQDYTPPTSYAPAPPAADPSRLPQGTRLPAPDRSVAYIDLHLPQGSRVWAEGVEMPGSGTYRRFITPSLEEGELYSYEFRIVVPEGDKEVTLVRHISVQAGDRKSLRILDVSGDQ